MFRPRPLPPVVYVRGDPNKAGPGRAPVETPGWSTVIAVVRFNENLFEIEMKIEELSL